ncbi:MAG: hypothetical protein ACLSUD_05015 [Lachnospiraceae bacterium]
MSPEKYREYINEMVSSIGNEHDLRYIYGVVHRKFINPSATDLRREEKHMNEERDLKLFEIMDELDVDMDTAELLLEDMEEADECED